VAGQKECDIKKSTIGLLWAMPTIKNKTKMSKIDVCGICTDILILARHVIVFRVHILQVGRTHHCLHLDLFQIFLQL
jgi:hypothetical protein